MVGEALKSWTRLYSDHIVQKPLNLTKASNCQVVGSSLDVLDPNPPLNELKSLHCLVVMPKPNVVQTLSDSNPTQDGGSIYIYSG